MKYSKALVHVKNVLEQHICKEEYIATETNIIYRDASHAFSMCVDFLERYAQVNLDLIRDHDFKMSINKKTRRAIPDRYFREATELMVKMLEVFQSVKIKPISAREQYTIAEYYGIKLSNWDR